MQNKLLKFIRQEEMICPGDTVICAVSGGADSVALLFAMYLLKEKLEITLEAAHFNHHLRGAESDRDEVFAGISGLHSRRTRGDRHSSRVEAKNPALLSNRDGYLLELTGWTQGSQAS